MFDFSCIDELGERVNLTLSAELMGRSANIILTRENGNIIDAVRRADLTATEAGRCILPGMKYSPLPRMSKLDMTEVSSEELITKIKSSPDERLSGSILSSVEGMSPATANELCVRLSGDTDILKEDMTLNAWDRLSFELSDIKREIENGKNKFYIYYNEKGLPKDFSYIKYSILPEGYSVSEIKSATETLETFFGEKIKKERAQSFTSDLYKTIKTKTDRVRRKIGAQKKDLEECGKREDLKLKGELITANIYRISAGDNSVFAENYYDEKLPIVEIKLDKRLTPSQNAQKYYKEYNKLAKAEEVLSELIEKNKEELCYLESVLDEISRAENEAEAMEIKAELTAAGYLREKRGKKMKHPEGDFKRETSSDGFQILIGRNNVQNDRLTFKVAEGRDIWLHAKDIPGSHVIIRSDGREISDRAIFEAATLAAANSSGREAGKVAVDYTFKKFVKKPSGAAPGRVIYTDQTTLYVDPRGKK
jgi:predicted ribosome quality control (RQC) complex YloA/Tae2 family protein